MLCKTTIIIITIMHGANANIDFGQQAFQNEATEMISVYVCVCVLSVRSSPCPLKHFPSSGSPSIARFLLFWQTSVWATVATLLNAISNYQIPSPNPPFFLYIVSICCLLLCVRIDLATILIQMEYLVCRFTDFLFVCVYICAAKSVGKQRLSVCIPGDVKINHGSIYH